MSSGDWLDLYRKKVCTAEEAARAVKSGDRIMNPLSWGTDDSHHGCHCGPQGRTQGLRVHCAAHLKLYKMLKPEYRGSFRIN